MTICQQLLEGIFCKTNYISLTFVSKNVYHKNKLSQALHGRTKQLPHRFLINDVVVVLNL